MKEGLLGLKQAFQYYLEAVESGSIDPVTQDGCFSFILTRRQKSEIKKVCNEHDWVDPEERGITFTNEYFLHVLSQRKGKDSVSTQDCAAILASAYSDKSSVAVNRPRYENDRERDQQALIFNAKESISVGGSHNLYGVAVIEISIKNLTPITAYHARGAKVKAFGRS
ncbi:hypothetical protein DCE53_17070 (plasmid) [Edwardsiella piscicida]|uniref:Uncharacterized protein n=1 Tax=Edwardsiella piscicida TaxID=1263550 RepID=A0A8F5V6N0_EDWPI|nr:hypothetical protein [Edwardsiella piscicida]QXO85651.1 hypothetical protein [Edwardsiella piscicida]UCQ16390.1 hypothetical protein DCE53_17070 [Edwardsiella piscicida]